MEPVQFLDAISGYVRTGTDGSADKPIRLAIIDPAYVSTASPYPDAIPPARVTFEGEGSLSGKSYPVAAGYIPTPGARVWMVPIGTTYLIVGSAAQYTAQGFYGYTNGISSGLELGEGNYFDTVAGLNLLTDADIAGDLTVGGIGAYLFKRRSTDSSNLVNNTLANDAVMTLTLDVGTWEVHHYPMYTGTSGNIQFAWAFSGTATGLKTCIGLSPFPINTSAYASSTTDTTTTRDSAPLRSSVHQLATAVPYNATDASSYQGAHEFGLVTVTVAGALTIQVAQHTTQAGAPSIYRNTSFMTARRVA